MAKYYCILFDADNTLLNFDAAENKALAETLVNFGIEPDAETVQTYRTINEELWRQLEKGQIRREKLFGERFSRFLKAIDAAGDGVEMNRCYLEQLSTHPDLMSPEVLDVLRELSEVATLAIVSNGAQKVQTRRLAESGVMNFMEDVFISEKMGCEKPNARIFDAALRALGVENREHVLMVGDSLDGELGAVLSIDVLGVALAHDVGDLAVTVDIALGLGLEDQLALISTGLTCVSTNVAALALVGIQHALLGLTVDEHDGGAGGRNGINDGLSGSGLDGVDDQHVHALLQEGVDLLGLGVLVVLAIDDGDGVAHILQVLFQIGAVQGHEVISELIDADADVCAAGGSGCRRCSGGSCSRGCSRGCGSGAGGAAAGGQNASGTHNSGSLHEVTTRNHFHNNVLLHSHITAKSNRAHTARFVILFVL